MFLGSRHSLGHEDENIFLQWDDLELVPRVEEMFDDVCSRPLSCSQMVGPFFMDCPRLKPPDPVQPVAHRFCHDDGLYALNSLAGVHLYTRHNNDWGHVSRCLIQSRFAHLDRAIACISGYWRKGLVMALTHADFAWPLTPAGASRRGVTWLLPAGPRPLHAFRHIPQHDTVSVYAARYVVTLRPHRAMPRRCVCPNVCRRGYEPGYGTHF